MNDHEYCDHESYVCTAARRQPGDAGEDAALLAPSKPRPWKGPAPWRDAMTRQAFPFESKASRKAAKRADRRPSMASIWWHAFIHHHSPHHDVVQTDLWAWDCICGETWRRQGGKWAR